MFQSQAYTDPLISFTFECKGEGNVSCFELGHDAPLCENTVCFNSKMLLSLQYHRIHIRLLRLAPPMKNVLVAMLNGVMHLAAKIASDALRTTRFFAATQNGKPSDI